MMSDRRSPDRRPWRQTLCRASLIAAVATGASLTAVPAFAQSAPLVVQDGYLLLDRGWVDDAIATFQQAVQRYPQSTDAQLGLAIAYQRAGRDADAWAAYRRVLELDASNRPALAAIGTLGSYRPEWQPDGIAALTTLLELEPDNTSARAQRALLYGYQGQFAAAIADYEPLLPLNPSPDVLLGAAQVYTYSGDYGRGVELFDRYQATGATIPPPIVAAYGQVLQETGSADRAIQLLEPYLTALSIADPTAIQIRATLATAYQANGQPQLALTTLQPLYTVSTARLTLARTLSAIGRQTEDADLYAEAVTLYQQVLQDTTDPSLGLLTEIADVWRDSEAIATQQQALQIYRQLTGEISTADLIGAGQSALWVKRTVLEYQLGELNRTEMRQQMLAVLAPLPESAVEQRQVALALIRLDPPHPAFLPIYQQLLQAHVEVPFLHYRLAQLYVRQNNLAEAKTALAAYLAAIGSSDPAAELLLAEIDRQEGNIDSSEQRYERLLALYAGEIRQSALRGLAGIRLIQGDPEAALALYTELVQANPTALFSRMGQAGIAVQLGQLSQATATDVLAEWLVIDPNVEDPPPEAYTLTGALPPNPDWEFLYDGLLQFDPDSIAINRRWVQIWAERDPAVAQERVDLLLVRNPDPIGVRFIQGELAQTLGNLSQASLAYEEILVLQPDNPDALSALGGIRFQQNRYTEAVALYQQVLQLRPTDREARRVLAELSAIQDHPQSAIEQLQNLRPFVEDQSLDATARAELEQRIDRLRIDLLRRRGFQPYWDQY